MCIHTLMSPMYILQRDRPRYTPACSPLTQTQPPPPAAHIQYVCVSSKQWVETTNSAGEGRSRFSGFGV